MKRRDFIFGAAALPVMATVPTFAQTILTNDGRSALVGKPWDPKRNALMFDAMGKYAILLQMN